MQRKILTKKKIIQESVIIIENGENLTFSIIAKRLKTSSQSLYNYFDNLQDLRYTIVAWAVNATAENVRMELFGLSGLKGVLEFAEKLRVLCLKHKELSRFVLTTPRSDQYPAVNTSFEQLRKLLNQMLQTVFIDKHDRLLASRLVRNLIVGDVLNVGLGWFTDPLLSPKASFSENLTLSLRAILSDY